MSVIETFYNNTCAVKRMSTLANGNKSLTQVSSGNEGFLHPVRNKSQLLNEGNWGKEYRWYCSQSVDIKTGDILTIGSKDYGVEAFVPYDDMFEMLDEHQVVILTLKNVNG